VLVESYPFAAWKSLGLKPLPAKRRAKVSDLAEAYGALRALIPFTTNRLPNHDQLQAIVGGLPGLALEERNTAGARIVGNCAAGGGGQISGASLAATRGGARRRLGAMRFVVSQVPKCEGPGAPGENISRTPN
jgi:hypothetical protein